MSSEDFVEKRVDQLKAGDIFDVSPVAYGFGWRYHVLRKDAKRSTAHPEQVHFDCDVWRAKVTNARSRDYFGWPLHVDADTVVRVYVGAERDKLENVHVEDSEEG